MCHQCDDSSAGTPYSFENFSSWAAPPGLTGDVRAGAGIDSILSLRVRSDMGATWRPLDWSETLRLLIFGTKFTDWACSVVRIVRTWENGGRFWGRVRRCELPFEPVSDLSNCYYFRVCKACGSF